MPELNLEEVFEQEGCRRSHRRKDAHLKGRLILNDACSYACVIHNTSPGGAKLSMEEPHYVPPRFELELSDYGTTISCRRAWQAGSEVGAHFLSALIVHLNKPPARD